MKKHLPTLLLCLLSTNLPTTKVTHQQPIPIVDFLQPYKTALRHFCKICILPSDLLNLISLPTQGTLLSTP